MLAYAWPGPQRRRAATRQSGWRFGFNNNGENKVWAVPYQDNLAERVRAALEELDVFGGHEEVTLA